MSRRNIRRGVFSLESFEDIIKGSMDEIGDIILDFVDKKISKLKKERGIEKIDKQREKDGHVSVIFRKVAELADYREQMHEDGAVNLEIIKNIILEGDTLNIFVSSEYYDDLHKEKDVTLEKINQICDYIYDYYKYCIRNVFEEDLIRTRLKKNGVLEYIVPAIDSTGREIESSIDIGSMILINDGIRKSLYDYDTEYEIGLNSIVKFTEDKEGKTLLTYDGITFGMGVLDAVSDVIIEDVSTYNTDTVALSILGLYKIYETKNKNKHNITKKDLSVFAGLTGLEIDNHVLFAGVDA